MSTKFDQLMYATYDRLQSLVKKLEGMPAAKTTFFLQELTEIHFMVLGILDEKAEPTAAAAEQPTNADAPATTAENNELPPEPGRLHFGERAES